MSYFVCHTPGEGFHASDSRCKSAKDTPHLILPFAFSLCIGVVYKGYFGIL